MRVAHLSDVHLLSVTGTRVGEFVRSNGKRLLGGLNVFLNRGRHYSNDVFEAMVADINGQGIDHVACTGDITNLALESEYRFARGLFDRLKPGAAGVTCIPGNHDNYITDADGVFERTFAPYCAGDADWDWQDGAGGHWPIVRLRGDTAIVALSSSRPTHLLAAYGMVGGLQLARLERALTDPRVRDKFRLVMIHHPPAGRWARSQLRGLHDHQAFAAVLARCGADLVLHGHEHLDLRHLLSGPAGRDVPVRGIQSGSYVGSNELRQGRYRIYTLGRTAGRPSVVAEELRVFRPSERAFASEGVLPHVA